MMMIELLPTLITHSDLKLREGEAPMKDIYKILQSTKCEFCTYLINNHAVKTLADSASASFFVAHFV